MEMTAATDGNLRSIFLQCAPNVDIANRRAELQGPLDAEISSDCPPAWYVLVTEPSHERIVAGHLIGRRFGIYLPTISRDYVSRGRRRVSTKLMFPGYLFVFGWDIQEQQRRVLSCPGALHFLHADGHLLKVPDADINHIQAVETMNDAEVRAAVQEVVNADAAARKPCKRSKRKKWKKKGRKNPPIMLAPEGPIEVTISPRSVWAGIERLSEEDRISLLHVALGLGSSAASSPVSPVAGAP